MKTVSTKIEPALLDRFADLSFKPAQALAEFIDNAVQSWLDNKHNPCFGSNYQFVVEIIFDWAESTEHKTLANRITIRDNAAGIQEDKFETAFMTAHKPKDDTGMNEYGMGMKTASCWFSHKWSLTSKALGETVIRTTTYDVNKIIQTGQEEIEVTETEDDSESSYTIVTLDNLIEKNNITKGKLNKIRKSLASIYRRLLLSNEMELYVDGIRLTFKPLEVLEAPYFKDYTGKKIRWCKNVEFKFGDKYVKGFIGLLKEQSDRDNRIVIIRRGRVVVGEDHELRPAFKCLQGQTGSPRDKRVFGEIEVHGFNATFNKNGISEGDELEIIIQRIAKEQLFIDKKNMLTQAQNFTKKEYLAVQGATSNSGSNGTSNGSSNTHSGGTNTETSTSTGAHSSGGYSTGGYSTREYSTGDYSTGGNSTGENNTSGTSYIAQGYKNGQVVTSKVFNYEGNNYVFELITNQTIRDVIHINTPDSNGKIVCLFNNKKFPLEDPDIIPIEVAKLLISFAIATFITQQRNGKYQDLVDLFNEQIVK